MTTDRSPSQVIMSVARANLFLCFFLVSSMSVSSANVCSVSLPSYNETTFNGSSFTSGVQLLVPSWNFSCQGTVDEWTAHVTGDSSIEDSIEFQVFELDSVNSNIYHVVYGNSYRGNNADGSRITETVPDPVNPSLPIRPGYIVGIYISPNVLNEVNLLYEDTGDDIDIYYWENVTERTCDFSLCEAKIIRGMTPLVGWIFRNFSNTAISQLQETLDLFKQNKQYCTAADVSDCVVSSPSVVSTQETFVISPSSASIFTTTGIVTGVATSTLLPETASIETTSMLPETPSTKATSTETPSTEATSTILLLETPSRLPETTTNSSILTQLLVSSSLSMFTTGTTSTPSLFSSHPPTPILSSSLPDSSVATTSPTAVSSTTPQSTAAISIQLIAALGVVVILFLMVVILSLIVCICCLMRHKSAIEVSVTQSIENPDYTGAISMGSVKRREDTFNSSVKNGLTQIPLPNLPPLSSPQQGSDLINYYPQADLLLSPGNRPATQKSLDTRMHSMSTSVPLLQDNSLVDDYDIPKPSASVTHTETQHYYSSPPPVDSPPSHSVDPYYSLPTNSGQFIQGNGLDENNLVPSTQDPEVTDTYDMIVLKEQQDKGATAAGGDSVIYAYVPTSEQRLLSWRYEIPADQEYDKLNFFVVNKTFWKPAATTSGLYEQLASNKYREINRKEIDVGKTLGEGQFGYVSKGVWTSPDGRHEVAVKMLRPEATEQDRLKLLQEAAIMGQFSHKNVVKLHGVVTIGEPVMMILEFMPRGDLRSYLRSIRAKLSKMNSLAGLPKLLLKFCRDIAAGMCYLSFKSFVHRDLAARNVLLSSDLTCKIGDFGMARDLMEDENNYYKSSGGIIPLKWTAPEALNFKKYTSASDVWSYGMVLYEIWSLGNKPFNDLSNPIVIALVNSKHCQAPPPGCSRAVYRLMVDCWNPEYSLRPKFDHIIDYLKVSDESLLQWSKKDLGMGKGVHLLGAPLEESTDLYLDLQRTYQAMMMEQ